MVHYDRLGVGLSDRERRRFTLASEVADFSSLADYLRVERAHLFGSSFGGPVALAWAAQHPERVSRLVLYGTYAHGRALAGPEVQRAFTSLVHASWGLGSRALADLFVPGAGAGTLRRYARLQRDACDAAMAKRLLGLSYALDARKHQAAVRAPTLVLHRRGDRAIPMEMGRQLAASGSPEPRWRWPRPSRSTTSGSSAWSGSPSRSGTCSATSAPATRSTAARCRCWCPGRARQRVGESKVEAGAQRRGSLRAAAREHALVRKWLSTASTASPASHARAPRSSWMKPG